MSADRLVRWTAVAAVLAVAGVAALISYRHAVDVVTVHGEGGVIGKCYPIVIDGVVVAASMVLLDAARHREAAPRLAWGMLAAGIGVTLAVNVLAGTASGLLGAVIAAWPAAAFVGCYELIMLLVRASARRQPPGRTDSHADPAVPGWGAPGPAAEGVTDPGTVRAALNGHAATAEQLFGDDVTAGRVPGRRRVMRALHVGDAKARLVQEHLRSVIGEASR